MKIDYTNESIDITIGKNIAELVYPEKDIVSKKDITLHFGEKENIKNYYFLTIYSGNIKTFLKKINKIKLDRKYIIVAADKKDFIKYFKNGFDEIVMRNDKELCSCCDYFMRKKINDK